MCGLIYGDMYGLSIQKRRYVTVWKTEGRNNEWCLSLYLLNHTRFLKISALCTPTANGISETLLDNASVKHEKCLLLSFFGEKRALCLS